MVPEALWSFKLRTSVPPSAFVPRDSGISTSGLGKTSSDLEQAVKGGRQKGDISLLLDGKGR